MLADKISLWYWEECETALIRAGLGLGNGRDGAVPRRDQPKGVLGGSSIRTALPHATPLPTELCPHRALSLHCHPSDCTVPVRGATPLPHVPSGPVPNLCIPPLCRETQAQPACGNRMCVSVPKHAQTHMPETSVPPHRAACVSLVRTSDFCWKDLALLRGCQAWLWLDVCPLHPLTHRSLGFRVPVSPVLS